MSRNNVSLLVYLLLLLLISFILKIPEISIAATCDSRDWPRITRRWIGPYWWADPLQDWRLISGRAVAPTFENRVLVSLPCYMTLSSRRAKTLFNFQSTVSIFRLKNFKKSSMYSPGVGFRLGMRGLHKHYLSDLLDAVKYIDALVTVDGTIRIGPTRRRYPSLSKTLLSGQPISLILKGKRISRTILSVTFSILDRKSKRRVTIRSFLRTKSVQGGFALLTHGVTRTFSGPTSIRRPTAYASFSRVSFSGVAVTKKVERLFGPVLWTQYTLSSDVLRVLAHFVPFEKGKRPIAHLYTWSGRNKKHRRQVRHMISLIKSGSNTALFTLRNWKSSRTYSYFVRVTWNRKIYQWTGTIRPEPKARSQNLKIGVFSCDHGYMFPHTQLVSSVISTHNPDILFFAGDQIYEMIGGFGVARHASLSVSLLDFHRRFWRFGLTWRNALRDRPSIILPDDHDVFQGNLWGAGGKVLRRRKFQWGGYLMSGQWLNAIETCYVGNLPPSSFHQNRLPNGGRPYFTTIVYGGISFVVLEDRKFKSGPFSIPTNSRIHGGDGDLLGRMQEFFLRKWGQDWKGHELKIALSQTIFSKANTHGTYEMTRSKYPYFDSGAWPAKASMRAVDLLSKANAFSIHGDQHLGILLKRKGVTMFMVPGTANGWPRAFWPRGKGKRSTGNVVDDAGNAVKVLAVANPSLGSERMNEKDESTAFRKGSGYGMVVINKRFKTATFNIYRVGSKRRRPQHFKGFPKTVFVGGNPRRVNRKN